MNLPAPRVQYYASSNFDDTQRLVTKYANEVTEALGYYPVLINLGTLKEMKGYATAVLFMGLIFDKNEYGLEKITRRAELNARYEAIIAQNFKPLIIDCGAHCGIATKFFAETYPQARIVAVEPDEDNVALARQTNSGDGIAVLCAAIGNADGTGSLEREDRSFAHRVNASVGGEVRILSINTLLDDERRRGAQPFIVKIVIEGSEENLFADNTDWIDAFPLLIIELHDGMLPGAANARNFLREMGKRDRDFLYHGKNIFSLSNTLR